jgi:hypothetical protein
MKRFLLYFSEAYGVPIGVPLQYVIEKRGYEVKWFCDESHIAEKIDLSGTLLTSVDEVMDFDPNVVLVTSNTVADFFPGIKVQIFHGFSVGKRSAEKGHFNIRGFFDLYCTQGPSTTLPFQKLQQKHHYFQVVETGWSKVDPLFQSNGARAHTIPTIMISSTFTTRLSLAKNDAVVEEIKRLSKMGRWRFIAVLHPKMEAEVVEKFQALQSDHFTYYDTVDLIPLYREADMMLADTTSAITEFILQKKPVVTINNNQPADHMINITDPGEIESALAYALSRPEKVMKDIETFIEKTHPYCDGRSSERVIDACLDFLTHEKVKRKPLNLIRRFKIRQKLNYFKF